METRVMQTRCPLCGGEQYVLNVITFSDGKSGCTCCGQRTIPMTEAEWVLCLRELWNRKEST